MNLDELERMEREATEGPWVELSGSSARSPYLFANPRGPHPWNHDLVGRFDYNTNNDRAFIAALRNAARELIADARKSKELLAVIKRASNIMQGGEGVQDQGEAWDRTLRLLDAVLAQETKP